MLTLLGSSISIPEPVAWLSTQLPAPLAESSYFIKTIGKQLFSTVTSFDSCGLIGGQAHENMTIFVGIKYVVPGTYVWPCVNRGKSGARPPVNKSSLRKSPIQRFPYYSRAINIKAKESIVLVHAIRQTMQRYKQGIREKASRHLDSLSGAESP